MATSGRRRIDNRVWALLIAVCSIGSKCSAPHPPPLAGLPDGLLCSGTLQRCVASGPNGCTQFGAPISFRTNGLECADLSVSNTAVLQDAQCQAELCPLSTPCVADHTCICKASATGTLPGRGCDAIPAGRGVTIGTGSSGGSSSGSGACKTPSNPGVSTDAVCTSDDSCCAPYTCNDVGYCGCDLAPPNPNAGFCDQSKELQADAAGNPISNGQGGFLRAQRPQCCDSSLHCVTNPSGVIPGNPNLVYAVCGQCKLTGATCDLTKKGDCCLGEGDCGILAGSTVATCIQNSAGCLDSNDVCRALGPGGAVVEQKCCADPDPNTGYTPPPQDCPNAGVIGATCG